MPDFRDSFTAREVCEEMLSQINVLQDPHRLVQHCCHLTMLSTLASSARFVPQSSEQQSKLGMRRCSRCYGRYRVVALRKYSLLEILVEEETGSGSSHRGQAQAEVSPLSSLRFLTFVAVGDLESVISHQKWRAAHFSGSSRSSGVSSSQVRFAADSALMS